MGILTEEMKRVVTEIQLCYAATVTLDGKPNLSPKGSIAVLSDDELWEAGAELGERLTPELVTMLDAPPVSYGKGAIVGVQGETEHGGACCHPMLGKPMRAAVGGGQALIASNVKVAPPGASIDIPIGHKDEAWSFAHFDTIPVSIADSPRPREILVAIVVADGGRLDNRCGTEPIR